MKEYPNELEVNTGKGTVTLYQNSYGETEKFHAKVDKNSVSIENLVARIMKKNVGVHENEVRLISMLLRDEILEAIENCESVNLLDLGTLYVGVGGIIKDKTDNINQLDKKIKFTPSNLLKEKLENITFEKISYCENEPVISKVTNLDSKNNILTAGCMVELKGERLKFATTKDKIFLANVQNDIPNKDENTWIECSKVYVNKPKTLIFSCPENISKGEYVVVVKSFSTGYKERSFSVNGYSPVVKVE